MEIAQCKGSWAGATRSQCLSIMEGVLRRELTAVVGVGNVRGFDFGLRFG